MEIQFQLRKRIWDVDCLSLDGALAASFDWRDLMNILQSSGHDADLRLPESILEIRAQLMIHAHCHSENPLSLKIESLLNQWHAPTIESVQEMRPEEIHSFISTHDLHDRKKMAGIFWALGADSRDELNRLRRFLHQRHQIVSIRRSG